MSASLDIELFRQVFRPGDKVEGTAMVNPGKQVHLKEVTLSLQGEEVAGASSLTRTKILPLINEVHTIPLSDSVHYPFLFSLPASAPPSYASEAFKCSYYIKGRIAIPWAFDVIEKLHITLVPYEPAAENKTAEEFSFEEEGLRGRIELEKDILLAGDTLTGVLHLDYTLDETPMTVELQVHAQERSLLPGHHLTRTIWQSTRELEIKNVDTGYTMVRFEFPIPADAPFSHRWNIFEVAWELLITISRPDKNRRREGKPLTIRRMI